MPNTNDNKTKDVFRAPIVTIMGHVDHGKTSILDAIRETNVHGQEYGGITQHIGAYQVTHNGKKITFIDTPGHEAFTQMRARGGRAADIVILVVAADEGVKPQTREAISHIKAAKVPVLVAINKTDTPGSNPQRVKQELSQENILVEEWGGDVMSVEVSAKNNTNIDKLLDAILLLADVIGIKANPDSELEAVIIESRLDKKKGVIVTGIVRNGTLSVGDKITASGHEAKVRSLLDDKGNVIKNAGPSDPVSILGFSQVPRVGDLIVEAGSDLAQIAMDENKVEIIGNKAKKLVELVLKADTQGTLEAVKSSLAKLISSSVEATYAIKFLYSGTGDVTDSDVTLAQGAKGLVLGFNVNVSSSVYDYAETNKVTVKVYKTIYDLIDDAKKLLEGTAIEEEAKIKGRAQVLKIFKLPSGDIVAGSKVLVGALKEGIKVSIFDKDPADITKNDIPLYTGTIKKLKKGREDVNVVGRDNECGVLLKPQYDDIKAGLWIEVR